MTVSSHAKTDSSRLSVGDRRNRRRETINGINLSEHLGLIGMAVRRYRWALGTTLEPEDLFNAGFFGLRRAAQKFDPELGFKFSTYALHWVQQSMARAIANERRTVRVPIWAQDEAWQRGEPIPLDAYSLDAACATGDTESASWGDLLASADDPSDQLDETQRRKAIATALAELPERLRGVLVARFWGEQTLRQIGAALDLSRERIRQLEAEALGLLRLRLKEAAP